MTDRSHFSKDEMKLINSRATRAMEPFWEHCRDQIMPAALDIKRRTGGLTAEALAGVRVVVTVEVAGDVKNEKPF